MILKQNAFVITDNELDALEAGTYTDHTRTIKCTKGLQTVYAPTSYTGSSIQRNAYKSTKTLTQEIVELKLQLRKKDITEQVYNSCTRRLAKLEILRDLKKEKKQPVERELSRKSKSKITQKVLAWARAAEQKKNAPRFTFLTLTVTSKQIGTDADFTKMQNVFFTYCRKYFGAKKLDIDENTGEILGEKSNLNYLYVLEKQTKKTGNIHSHVLFDRPLPIQRLNYIWCKILGDNGYTFESTDRRTGKTTTLNVIEALRAHYESPLMPNQKMGHKKRYVTSPNPADIKFIYNLKAVSHYVTKYITKNETKINTSIWNCSQSISKLWTGAIISPLTYYAQLREQTHKVIRQTLDVGHVLNICLLKFYTKLQEEIFTKVNNQYLTI